jgi:hypothetical protein
MPGGEKRAVPPTMAALPPAVHLDDVKTDPKTGTMTLVRQRPEPIDAGVMAAGREAGQVESRCKEAPKSNIVLCSYNTFKPRRAP